MNDLKHEPSYQAFRLLQVAFIIAPIVAGLDKFFYLLTNWSQYIAPFTLNMINNNDRVFMMIVGIMELVVGIGVLFKPKPFAYIVAAWLLCIIINLFMTGQYFDLALRDTGLMLAAVALAKLSPRV